MRLLFCFPKKVAQLAATTSLISFPETNINMGKLTLYPETRMVELDEEALSSQTMFCGARRGSGSPPSVDICVDKVRGKSSREGARRGDNEKRKRSGGGGGDVAISQTQLSAAAN